MMLVVVRMLLFVVDSISTLRAAHAGGFGSGIPRLVVMRAARLLWGSGFLMNILCFDTLRRPNNSFF